MTSASDLPESAAASPPAAANLARSRKKPCSGPPSDASDLQTETPNARQHITRRVSEMTKKMSEILKSGIPASEIQTDEKSIPFTPPFVKDEDIVAEMRDAMKFLAGEPLPGDTHKTRISRAARRAGLTPQEARSLTYGLNKHVRARVADQVRIAVRQKLLTEAQTLRQRADVYQRIATEMHAA